MVLVLTLLCTDWLWFRKQWHHTAIQLWLKGFLRLKIDLWPFISDSYLHVYTCEMIHSSALPNCHSAEFCLLWHMWHLEMWFVMNYPGNRSHLGYRQNISDAAVLYLVIAIYLVLQIGVVLFWLHLLISLVRLYQGVILVILTPWVHMIG